MNPEYRVFTIRADCSDHIGTGEANRNRFACAASDVRCVSEAINAKGKKVVVIDTDEYTVPVQGSFKDHYGWWMQFRATPVVPPATHITL